MDFPDYQIIIGSVGAFLLGYQTVSANVHQREANERADAAALVEARISLKTALRETQYYLETVTQLSTGLIPFQDDSSEHKLRSLWENASELVRPFDTDLSTRCAAKGRYWIEPWTWSIEQVQSAGIQIATMNAKIDNL